jgi:acetyl-CoA C-acetyltransferase
VRAPLGRSDNYPQSVAGRIGARQARAILEVSGGQAPEHLVNEFAAVIAAGWPSDPWSLGTKDR